MKHSMKITLILVAMFFIAQIIGLFVTYAYLPQETIVVNQSTGVSETVSSYDLPYGFNPPQDVTPQISVFSILAGIILAVLLVFLIMRLKATYVLRVWFFVVVTIGLALALNAFIHSIQHAALIAVVIALPLSYFKVFKRNIVIHNLTELFIYPGIAAVFVPLLTIPSVIILLILISVYDIYAVWHAGFMQKMAKYQIQELRVFSGFFIPYLTPKDRALLKKLKNKTSKKKIKVNVAILGGGDVVFPIILAGVVLRILGVLPALMIALCATLALGLLLYYSEKGKFYPAMPFISAGCFLGLALAYLVA